MLNKFANWLVPKLEDWCVKTGRVYTIKGRPDTPLADEPYLIRHFLFRSKYFSIYLHRFMRSDEGDHHCHPFSFASYIVNGSYTEEQMHWVFQGEHIAQLKEKTRTLRKQGTLAVRNYKATHMVFIDRAYSAAEKKLAPCTVVFRGPQVREWAFYPLLTGTNYQRVLWRDYLHVKEDAKAEFE